MEVVSFTVVFESYMYMYDVMKGLYHWSSSNILCEENTTNVYRIIASLQDTVYLLHS